MSRRWLPLQVTSPLIALGLLVSLTVGCGPKPPDTPPAMDMSNTDVESPPDVTPSPNPPTRTDPVEPPLPSDLAELTDYLHKNGLLGDIYFAFDSSELTGDARDRLAKNARFLNEEREYTITIEGHCDERGTNEYNIALGERRSSAALEYLVSLGVDRNRLRLISYGEERPQCRESTEACWQQNRRAFFRVTGRS